MKRIAKFGLALMMAVGVLGAGTFAFAQSRGSAGSSPSATGSIPVLQRDILADGRVSDDEMREAVAATVQCIKDRGFTNVSVPPSGDDTKVDRTILIVAGDGAQAEADAAVFDCKAQFMDAVDEAYARQFAGPPKSQAEIAAQQERFTDCLVSRGYKTGPGDRIMSPAILDVIRATDDGKRAIGECGGR